MNKILELWTILRVTPPPPSPLVLGRMDVDGHPLPCGVAFFTSVEKAQHVLNRTLMVGTQGPATFEVYRLGTEPDMLCPQRYLGMVLSTFVYKAVQAGVSPIKAATLLAMAFGVYIDPSEPKDVLAPPTRPNLYQFLGGYFPKEITSMETTGVKFYRHNGYQVLIENLRGCWLTAAKRGESANIDEFRASPTKLGDAFYGTFDTAEKAVEEAELWINGTQALTQLM